MSSVRWPLTVLIRGKFFFEFQITLQAWNFFFTAKNFKYLLFVFRFFFSLKYFNNIFAYLQKKWIFSTQYFCFDYQWMPTRFNKLIQISSHILHWIIFNGGFFFRLIFKGILNIFNFLLWGKGAVKRYSEVSGGRRENYIVGLEKGCLLKHLLSLIIFNIIITTIVTRLLR